MTINLTNFSAALQAKLDALAGSETSQEYLLLAKAFESSQLDGVTTVATVTALPDASTNKSQLIFVEDDSSLYFSNGTAWVKAVAGAGAGTIAAQDSDDVSIIGGVIDGTVIGGVTPAAITGTTITATSFVGDATGNLTGDVTGNVTGDVTGNVTGNLTGNVTGNLTGDVTGDVTGNLTGDVTGDVTGNLTGDVTGNVTGDVIGNVTGNVIGGLTGNVTGDLTGNVVGNVTGDVTGNVIGNITGDITGNAGSATILQTARNIDVNGTDFTSTSASFDGSADATVTLGLTTTGVTANTYGSATAIPSFTVDDKGRISSATTHSIATTLNITDGTTSDAVSLLSDTLTFSDVTNQTNVVVSNNEVTVGLVDSPSIVGDLTIGGNLTVNGTTTTVNATNLSVTDNLIYLAEGNSTTNIDLGFAGNYNDGTYAHAGFFRDASDGRWKVFDGYTPEPDAAVDIDTTHASFSLADIQAGTFYGALSGNASTATTLQTARSIELTGDVTGSVSFDGSANASITTVVADDSHNHIIDNVDGLQAALDGKASTSHVHNYVVEAGTAFTGTYPVAVRSAPNTILSDTDLTFTGATGVLNTNGGYTVGNTHTVLHAGNYNSYAPTKTGGGASGTWDISITGSSASTTGNAATATTLETARTINGVSFDGSANITVADSTKLPLSGGTITGDLSFPDFVSIKIGSDADFALVHSAGFNYMTLTTGNLYIRDSGTTRFTFERTNGNFTATGDIIAFSDERLKKDWLPVAEDFVERLSKVKSGTYTRIDTDERQAGTSAQDWQALLPEAVFESDDENKTLALAYGNAALVSSVELAKRVVEQEERIKKLEALIEKLIGE